MGHNPTRREFIKQTAFGICAAGMPGTVWAMSGEGSVPRRTLGKTGEAVSILGLGGHHIGRIKDDQEAVRLIRQAVDMGVNMMDNAWEYHHGRSEELMGKALQDGYRDKVFLMSKVHGRDKKAGLKQLEESLKRLRTDRIDLWQIHEVVYEDDPNRIFAKDGLIEAVKEAKASRKVRYVGFTGHKDPAIFRAMLDHDYEWDTVQMPVNVLDAHFRSFQNEILPILMERNIGPIAMKTMGAGHVLKADVISPREALYYAWSQPVATIISGMESMALLKENVRLARKFKPLSEKEQASLLAKTEKVAANGEYELYKTSKRFDGWKGREIHGIPKAG